ncbi:MAG: response regulator [Candidatus Hodarchaeales archaeon]|jgi:CheY-like chemotaxis protein
MGADISLEVRDKVKIINQEEQKETIIIVDDNEDQLTMLKFLLAVEKPSHNIMTFSSAEQALDFLHNNKNIEENYLEYLDRFYSSVSLIISDYNMYPKNGLDFYKEMKKNGLSIPFVLISSFVSDKIKHEARNLGINDCIDKSVDVTKTIRSLASFLPG